MCDFIDEIEEDDYYKKQLEEFNKVHHLALEKGITFTVFTEKYKALAKIKNIDEEYEIETEYMDFCTFLRIWRPDEGKEVEEYFGFTHEE